MTLQAGLEGVKLIGHGRRGPLFIWQRLPRSCASSSFPRAAPSSVAITNRGYAAYMKNLFPPHRRRNDGAPARLVYRLSNSQLPAGQVDPPLPPSLKRRMRQPMVNHFCTQRMSPSLKLLEPSPR